MNSAMKIFSSPLLVTWQVSLPFLVLHGEDDIVADPSGSKLLHEQASSRDKTLKLYPGMWHVLMGEQPEDVERVFADVISWLDNRAPGTAKPMEMKAAITGTQRP